MPTTAELFERAREETRAELQQLETETTLVLEQLIIPGWGGPHHGLPRTLYGHMMNCFAFIDLLSQYREGGKGSHGQTRRMVSFMDDFFGHDHLAHEVTIQLWRHTLMHTAIPRALTAQSTSRRYLWLLHWGPPHLPSDQHMVFQQRSPAESIVNVGLTYLVRDILAAAEKLFIAAANDEGLQHKITTCHEALTLNNTSRL